MTFNCMYFEVPLCCDRFSQFPCIWWPWQFLGVRDGYIRGCPWLEFGWCFLMTILGMWTWAKDHRGKAQIRHSGKRGCTSIWFSNINSDLDNLAEVVLLRSLHHQLLLAAISLYSLEGSSYASPSLTEGDQDYLLRRGWSICRNYLKFFCIGDFSLLPLIQSFLFLRTHGYLFHALS